MCRRTTPRAASALIAPTFRAVNGDGEGKAGSLSARDENVRRGSTRHFFSLRYGLSGRTRGFGEAATRYCAVKSTKGKYRSQCADLIALAWNSTVSIVDIC